MDINDVRRKLIEYREDMKKDLSELIAINSERDLKSKEINAPFGRGIRECFDKIIYFAKREGFEVKDFHGYALHIEYGEGEEIVGILGHLDIVGIEKIEKWNTDPFALHEEDGFWYGRGVNDNKGPMIGSLYLLKVLKELGYKPKKKIRLIIGGAEETTWECMDHYFKYNHMPDCGFSPDGNFPIINCEKGIGYYEFGKFNSVSSDSKFNIIDIKCKEDISRVCEKIEITIETKEKEKIKEHISNKGKVIIKDRTVTVIYEGVSAKSRNPHKGENAIFKFVKDFRNLKGLDNRSSDLIDFLNKYFIDSVNGEKLGLFHEDDETGKTTSNLSYIRLNNKECKVSFDYRYTKGIDYHSIINKLENIGIENGYELKVIQHRPIHYVSPNSNLIRSLQESYNVVMGEVPGLFSKGAASYARVIENAVAFGPTFPGEVSNSHKENECINIDSLIKALLIYFEALKRL